MTPVEVLHRRWMNDPSYHEAYEALEFEFALAQDIIEARSNAGLTQQELADRLHTTQSVVARWESGKANPSVRTLKAVAEATGTRFRFSFEPVPI